STNSSRIRRRNSLPSRAAWPAPASGATCCGAACAHGWQHRRCATMPAIRASWRACIEWRGGAGVVLVDGMVDAGPSARWRRLAVLGNTLGIDVVEPRKLPVRSLARFRHTRIRRVPLPRAIGDEQRLVDRVPLFEVVACRERLVADDGIDAHR